MKFVALFAFATAVLSARAAEISTKPKEEDRKPTPVIAPASAEGLDNIKKFTVTPGFKVELVAAEPMLANPVAFCIDEKNRFFISETHRYRSSVLDIRHYMFMLEDDMAIRNVEERMAMTKKHFGDHARDLAIESEIVRLVEDRDGDGKADHSTIFADKFNHELDGIASGVLARKGKVYFTNIPHVWELQDTNGDGQADLRKSLSYGYGVRFSYTGHDLHGLAIGPDGKLYYSVGDRGANVVTKEGKLLTYPDEGAVFRCNLDGTELEVVHRGLRNPQELAFDDYGNLFTGDNDCDNGDHERWVYIAEGGESGWRVGYQHAPLGKAGQWMSEKLWVPHFKGQAAYILPPLANISDGPSGLTYNPGTGFPEKYKGHFFLTHFKGSAANSGITTFTVKPKGASFEWVDGGQFIWNCLPTDADFGYDGSMYFTDWHHDWPKSSRGRIYRVTHSEAVKDPAVAEVKKLFAEGFAQRSVGELTRLLAHKDKRVRQEVQFALVDKGAVKELASAAKSHPNQFARLHGIWGLGQLGRKYASALSSLPALLKDDDAEVRAQTAKVLGDARYAKAASTFIKLLEDPNSRVRYFAALGLGKLGRKDAVKPLLAMLRANNDQDLYLRHAGVMALTWIADPQSLLTAAYDHSPAVRMAALLAMRRLESPDIAMFLKDSDPYLVLEAARAINDAPVNSAMPALAALVNDPSVLPRLKVASTKDVDLVTPMVLRLVNASFRAGKPENATALATFAGSHNSLELGRAEAIHALATWKKPHPRDRVLGVYRPLPERNAQPAVDALRPVLANLLRTAPDSVRLAAIEAAVSLDLRDAAPVLAEVFNNLALPAATRVEALQALEKLKFSKLADLVKNAVADKEEAVRKEGNRLMAMLKPADAAASLTTVLQKGTIGEKQGALATLAKVNGADADKVIGAWLDKLIAGHAEKELQLDILEAAAKRTNGSIKDKLAGYEAKRPAEGANRYREVLYGGNAENGKKIFYERVEASCFRCHRLKGEGGEVGPALDGIATKYPREYLLEAIVDPNAKIAEGFDSLLILLKDGRSAAGVLKTENDTELTIISPEDGLMKIKKDNIVSRQKGMSGMPAGIGEILPRQDLRDLIEFVGSLK
ncbi:MAG: PVC-type heme-binding CxxCH protein [Verrucomicrobiota bacterium]